jgi:hypothetical protein
MMWRTTFLLLVLAASAQAAVTVVVRPSSSTPNSGDAYNSSASPTTNFGPSGALVVSGSGAANTKGEFQSVLKFDLAVVVSTLNTTFGTGQWNLDSVALELTAATPLNATFNANAAGSVGVDWLTTDSWTEAGITWNGLPALVSGGAESMGSFSYGGANSGTTQYTLASTAGFAADLASGGTTSLRLFAAGPDVSMVVNARNFGTAASRPALIITASASSPEPSRLMLLMGGLGALVLRRRRR